MIFHSRRLRLIKIGYPSDIQVSIHYVLPIGGHQPQGDTGRAMFGYLNQTEKNMVENTKRLMGWVKGM